MGQETAEHGMVLSSFFLFSSTSYSVFLLTLSKFHFHCILFTTYYLLISFL